MKTALFILAEDFEEIEALAPVDLCRRAGIHCTLAAHHENKFVIGKTGIQVVANTLFSQIREKDYDLLVLPGGPGVRHLRSDPQVLTMVQRQQEAGRWLAAICAAPLIIKEAGLIPTPYTHYTGHFSIAGQMPHPLAGEAVVRDGQLITSQGAGTAVAFGLALIEALLGKEKRDEIATSVCA